MSRCAIPGCTDPCRSRQLMCRWHWVKVPADLKASVNATWKIVARPMKEAPRVPAIRLGEIRRYVDAKKAAIAAVCKLEGVTPCL